MKKIKLNSFTSMFFLFSFIFIAFIFVKDEQIELYEHVTIEQGDTLWSLANQYRGKMAQHDWIHEVKKENALEGELVVSGQILVVPVEKNSKYISQLNEPSNMESIKVVRENNETN